MKPSHTLRISLLLVAALLLAIGQVSAQVAQVVLSGTNYFQDFNNLTTDGSLPIGWNVYETGVSTTSLGTLAVFHASGTNTWAATTGQFEDLASTIDNNGNNFTGTESTAIQEAATNRAPAVRETAAFGDTAATGLAFAVEIDSTLGLGNFKLDLDFLNLSPQTRTAVWTVDYGFGTSPSSFIPIGSFTNLSTTSGGVFGATHKTLTFSNSLDNQPGPIWIRVVNDTLTSGSGNRPTFGIDNFSLTYGAVAVVTNPVVILSQPASSTNGAGSTVTFTVAESGTGPIVNTWYQVINGVTNQLFDGSTPSGDGAVVSGSAGPSLTISGVLGYETASYFVVASNASTPATNSASASLTVIDPVVNSQPLNRTNLVGDLDEFDATVFASLPVELTWYHGTNVVSDVVNSFGTFTNTSTIFVTNGPATVGNYYLVASNAFGVVTTAVATATIPVTPSTVITRWDFDATGNYPPTAPLSSIGTGVGATVGGPTITNYLFANGSLADATTIGNEAWELEQYPAQGTSNKLVGFQFNTSTVGYQNIFLVWQERHSATASAYMRIQYSTNGTDFIDGDVEHQSVVAYEYVSSDLSSKPGVANNPNFAFRIVSEFESTAIGTTNNNYVATTPTSTYGPGVAGGTVRIDLMTVLGNAVGSVGIPLSIVPSGTNVVLSWADPSFQLETATQATGPWSTPLSVTSPFTNGFSGAQKFFRLVK